MRFGIVLDTNLGIERITPLANGFEVVRETARLVGLLAPELEALSKAVVSRSPTVSSDRLKKTELVMSST